MAGPPQRTNHGQGRALLTVCNEDRKALLGHVVAEGRSGYSGALRALPGQRRSRNPDRRNITFHAGMPVDMHMRGKHAADLVPSRPVPPSDSELTMPASRASVTARASNRPNGIASMGTGFGHDVAVTSKLPEISRCISSSGSRGSTG